MQYEIQKVLARGRGRNVKWELLTEYYDLPLSKLSSDYVNVVIELNHPTFETTKHFYFEDVVETISDFKQTFGEWITSMQGQSFPFKDGEPVVKYIPVDHSDVWMAGFNVEMTKMGSHPENDWPRSHKRDLLVTHPTSSIKDIFNHCIVSVNGLLHRTSYSEYGLYVVDGAHGKHESDKVQMALTSFDGIGKVEQINITSDMVFKPTETLPLYESTYINLGVPTEGKTLLLSLGGYLHVLDKTYLSLGDGLVKIDFNNYPMIQRYYESKDLIDVSGLEYTEFSGNPDQRMVKELLESEVWIKQLLDLSQTFAILIDTPSIVFSKQIIEKSNLPGTFYHHSKPRLPLMSQRGKLKEYWAKEDDGIWVINCDTNLLPNYQFEQGFYRDLYSVTPHKVPYKPFIYDRGFLLDIGIEYIDVK